uniref:Ion transport domain-containing protein n=1 Tax=Chromera velia CCMP2878 TaxID=1169474 RepID=A0A0G4IEC4_9ALVE|mmetsp:Transcript_55142/g.107853  ORF Transcript_55142/g.107853 Transcript_55142/m.107853 type:complete len:283 (+) Transcript_55142:191-1039(+)|eukprot:Cvel_13564.t1-p1 / transcript=Cvel_13564.t1 / gene=Cvel_13564 / organism=Chromera_velia_CCMP2878 / gene_product=Potassium voltage-gated channel subfamily D member, putative / transcript_product=Potassium voltage-gated channel subfamily D member, putative / location=Cvel_scaffold932:15679-19266(+) / protein_length=282 / sequence_SO=supercontig / SO=protein_coding / is_pseudo=false
MPKENEDGPKSCRGRIWDAVEGDFDSPFEYFSLFLIALNVVAFIVGTIVVEGEPEGAEPCDDRCVTLNDKYAFAFDWLERISIAVFTVEYVLRLWSCVEEPAYRAKGPIGGRIRYALSFFCLCDLCALAPFYYELASGTDMTDFATAIRGFRLIRLLKAEKYLRAFTLLGKVIEENESLLVACCYYSALCTIVFSTMLWITEKGNANHANHFRSIPQSMWVTMIMLTGEMPLSEFTPLGKIITGFMCVTAVAVFAVPTAVIGSGFVRAVQQSTGKEFTVDAA